VMEKVMGPVTFRLGDGKVKVVGCGFARGAFRVIDCSKGHSTILVPPPDSARVRELLWEEDFGGSKVNVRV